MRRSRRSAIRGCRRWQRRPWGAAFVITRPCWARPLPARRQRYLWAPLGAGLALVGYLTPFAVVVGGAMLRR